MKLLFISASPKNQEENQSLTSALLSLGFAISSTLSWNGKEYLVSAISADNKKRPVPSDNEESEIEAIGSDKDNLSGNEIIFVEQEHVWLAIDKANMVQILKAENPAERIKTIIQNYHQTVLA